MVIRHVLQHLLVWIALAAALCGPAGAEILARGVAFSPTAEGTRIEVEVTGEPVARVFTVAGPPRLVVDLEAVRFDLPDASPAAGLVTAWRFGALRPGEGRLVFDLGEPATVARHAFIPPRSGEVGRLVIDLVRAAPSAPGTDEFVVVLDPGHGGIDPGAVTANGVYESNLALAFARLVEPRLEAIPGVTVRLTRTADEFLSLNQRIRLARAFGADLFVSIHADAAPQDYVQGATVYTLSERATDAEAAALAARENLADSVSGAIEPDLQEEVSGILADLMRRETKTFSHGFAERLVASLRGQVRVNSNPHRSARFRVLMASDIPSVLFELGYLTNADDASALTDGAWQDRAAQALVAAVRDFAAAQPDTTAAAPQN